MGGGAGGVELALSVHYRLHAELAAAQHAHTGKVTVKCACAPPFRTSLLI